MYFFEDLKFLMNILMDKIYEREILMYQNSYFIKNNN